MLIATFAMAALLAAAPGAQQADTQQNHAEATCPHSAKSVKRVETRRDNPHSTVVGSPNALEYVATNEQFGAAETRNPYSTVVARPNALEYVATNEQFGATETRNPNSTVVARPNALEYVATNEQFGAPETGNPDGTDFRYSNQGGSGNGNVQALEAENPHNAQPGHRAPVATEPVATKCPAC